MMVNYNKYLEMTLLLIEILDGDKETTTAEIIDMYKDRDLLGLGSLIDKALDITKDDDEKARLNDFYMYLERLENMRLFNSKLSN